MNAIKYTNTEINIYPPFISLIKSLSEKDAAIDRIIKIIHIMNNGAL